MALLILLLLVLAVGKAAFGRGGARHRAPPGDLQTLDAQTYAAWIAGKGDTPRSASGTSGGVGHGFHGGGFHDGGFQFDDGAGASLTDCRGLSTVDYVGTENRLLEHIDCRTGSGDSETGRADTGGPDDLVPAGGDEGSLFGGLFGGGGHSGSGGGGGGGGFGGGGPGGNFGTFDPTGTIGSHDPGPPGSDPPPPNAGINPVTNLSVSAVPEPDVWAMLILGFGLVGYALRRRRAFDARAARQLRAFRAGY